MIILISRGEYEEYERDPYLVLTPFSFKEQLDIFNRSFTKPNRVDVNKQPMFIKYLIDNRFIKELLFTEVYLGSDVDIELHIDPKGTSDNFIPDINEDEADAARYRWLCDGNGCFMEEEHLCWGGSFDQKSECDVMIDESIRLGCPK